MFACLLYFLAACWLMRLCLCTVFFLGGGNGGGGPPYPLTLACVHRMGRRRLRRRRGECPTPLNFIHTHALTNTPKYIRDESESPAQCVTIFPRVFRIFISAGWRAPKKEKRVVETIRNNECLRRYIRVTLLLEMQLAIFAGKTPNGHRA